MGRSLHGFATCANVPPLERKIHGGPRERWAAVGGGLDATVRACSIHADPGHGRVDGGARAARGGLRPCRGSRRAPGGDDPGPRLAQPVQHPARRRVRGLRPHLQLPGRFRPEPRAGPRVRRQVDPCGRRPLVDLPHPRQHEVVGRAACHIGRCVLLVAARPRRDQGEQGRERLPRRRLPRPDAEGRRRHEGRLHRPDHDGRVDRRPVGPRAPGRDADHPQARLGQGDLQDHRGRQVRRPARRHRPIHGPGVADRPVHQARPQPQLLGHAGLPGRGRHRHLQGRAGHDGPGAQGR